MYARQILILFGGVALAFASAGAQSQRRAVLTGGGPGSGRCTGEVVVDGAADVEIRGDMATLSDLSGRPPEWRSFECTSAIPPNAGNVQFSSEGRGRARMVTSPYRNNGVAVIHIEDPEGGANPYRFVLTWTEGSAAVPRGPNDAGFDADQAVQLCQDAIRRQAVERFNARDMVFRRIGMNDNPGRNDSVVGVLEMRRPDGVEEHRRFSCSVNFEDGRVRSANIEEAGNFGADGGSADHDMTAREMEACRQAVGDRIRDDGYGRIDFGAMNIDSRYGNDWITGTARARGGYMPQSYEFPAR
jgi:hypothetical protein